MKTKLSVIQEVTTDGLYCGESKQELCPKYVPGGMCGQFDFIDLRSDEDGWLRADACIKAEERARQQEMGQCNRAMDVVSAPTEAQKEQQMSEMKETGKPKWLERAEEEQQELHDRLGKLGSALSNAVVRSEIASADLQDMLVQEAAMVTYNQALTNRIKRNGGTVCE